jgi:hypothetical protein
MSANEEGEHRRDEKGVQSEVRSPKSWIIHPGCLAGDPVHIAAALITDENLGTFIVTHKDVVRAWEGTTGEDLGTRVKNFVGIAHQKAKENHEKNRSLSVRHWQQMAGLIELLHQSNLLESGIDKRIHILGGLEKWDPRVSGSDMYDCARKAVQTENGSKQWIQAGDSVGLTMSSTSAITLALHNTEGADSSIIDTALNAAYYPNEKEKDYKVMLVMIRNAAPQQNPQHNTAADLIEQVLKQVKQHNEEGGQPKYKVLLVTQGEKDEDKALIFNKIISCSCAVESSGIRKCSFTIGGSV